MHLIGCRNQLGNLHEITKMSFVDLGTPPPKDNYPSWPLSLVERVDNALSLAWEHLQVKNPSIIATKDEDKITDELVTELTAMRKNDVPKGFNSNFFGVPIRDGKVSNQSGGSIDQMPDLTIHLAHPRQGVADDRHDALFYECKVITAKRNLHLYRKKGIQRFIEGQYAWRMPHAGMIGYIFQPAQKCPITALTSYFAKKVKMVTIGSALGCNTGPAVAMVAPNPSVSNIAATTHTRTFDSSQVELRHLWFF